MSKLVKSQKPIIAGFDQKYVGGAKFMIIFGISPLQVFFAIKFIKRFIFETM